MKQFSAILVEKTTKALAVREDNGSITKLQCPYSDQRCSYHCPLCGRVSDLGHVMGPGFYIDLRCGAGVRLEADNASYYEESQNTNNQ